MHSILVKDYMQPAAHAISVTANTAEVVERLLKSGLTGVPVIDEREAVVGFVSEQDCIKEMLNDAFFCEEPASVRKLMSETVLTVTPNTSIVELAQTMMREKPKNYPVVSDGKLVGIITRRHVLQALIDNDEDCYLRT
ncbi:MULTISPECIES: CBS domain-containing protein [Marinimicrobium]|jgi:CBS domain-containing protein|uniref:CBS domain protein n=1 Tax=Marinimicrobium koreense TaxID=306545 RepID=A0A3N1NW27_9GAMM|nr:MULTISPECIES: CBS domain-containing protein [Marinimicrobium]MAN52984.1 CBS domain-containing protein [Marinimicrobium sp.]ROQ20353.1 CBS domain protein [Marinimicrobium koreense]|tara:strand:+ start:95 stop:508 length:414 start_codon:yes stop_codon:yes gene_type:complete